MVFSRERREKGIFEKLSDSAYLLHLSSADLVALK